MCPCRWWAPPGAVGAVASARNKTVLLTKSGAVSEQQPSDLVASCMQHGLRALPL